MEILVSPGTIMPRVCDECPQEGPCTVYGSACKIHIECGMKDNQDPCFIRIG